MNIFNKFLIIYKDLRDKIMCIEVLLIQWSHLFRAQDVEKIITAASVWSCDLL